MCIRDSYNIEYNLSKDRSQSYLGGNLMAARLTFAIRAGQLLKSDTRPREDIKCDCGKAQFNTVHVTSGECEVFGSLVDTNPSPLHPYRRPIYVEEGEYTAAMWLGKTVRRILRAKLDLENAICDDNSTSEAKLLSLLHLSNSSKEYLFKMLEEVRLVPASRGNDGDRADLEDYDRVGGVDLTEQLEIWDADTDSEESEQEMPEEVVWEQVHRDDRLQLPNSGDFSNSLGPDSTGDGQRGEKSGERVEPGTAGRHEVTQDRARPGRVDNCRSHGDTRPGGDAERGVQDSRGDAGPAGPPGEGGAGEAAKETRNKTGGAGGEAAGWHGRPPALHAPGDQGGAEGDDGEAEQLQHLPSREAQGLGLQHGHRRAGREGGWQAVERKEEESQDVRLEETQKGDSEASEERNGENKGEGAYGLPCIHPAGYRGNRGGRNCNNSVLSEEKVVARTPQIERGPMFCDTQHKLELARSFNRDSYSVLTGSKSLGLANASPVRNTEEFMSELIECDTKGYNISNLMPRRSGHPERDGVGDLHPTSTCTSSGYIHGSGPSPDCPQLPISYNDLEPINY